MKTFFTHSRSILKGCAPIFAALSFLGFLQAQAGVVVGPWLEGDTTTNVDILVECDSAAPMTINYGLTTNYGSSITTTRVQRLGGNADFIHRIELRGLAPNTTYHYQWSDQGANSADATFSTVPSLALSQVPAEVRAAAESAARGRAIEKIERTMQFEGPQYRVFIADRFGPQLLTVDEHGKTIYNAAIIPFADLTQGIRDCARSAVAGRLQVCRKALQSQGNWVQGQAATYFIDYIVNEEEPVFALVSGTNGTVRAVYGYNESDGD